MKPEIGAIIIIIAILISCSVPVGATSDDTIIENNDESKNINLFKIAFLKRCFAKGNATSGRTVDKYGKIGIIEFKNVAFTKLKLFPTIRWEYANYDNAKAIVFGIDQDIPEGPFEFNRDWVRAIVFY